MTEMDRGHPSEDKKARGVSPDNQAEKKKVDAETRKKTAPFPDIIVDIKGDIILCIACKGSNLTRQDDGNNDEGHPSEDKMREECPQTDLREECPSTVMANVYVCNDCGAVWWQ